MSSPATFERAFKRTIGHEGGWVNNPNDPGGETKYGVTKRDHPDLDIANLTLEQAKGIYFAEYWLPLGAKDLADEDVACKVFDIAINCGTRKAIEILQRAINFLTPREDEVAEDGSVGPVTIAAANALDPDLLLLALRGEQYQHYRSLIRSDKTTRYETFARGWLRRAMA